MRTPKPKIKTVIHLALTGELNERFFKKVIKNETGCWEWNAAKTPLGYGNFSIKSSKISSHRVSYMIHHGPIPEGMFVCHKCDNPPCCNPDHLFLGTAKDNMHDMRRKGRGANVRGEKVGGAKLNPELVRQIREAVKSGLFQKKVAAMFGVCQMTVSLLVRRKIWSHVL